MSKTTLNFSVVVCAYNASGVIRNAIRSLQKQDYPKDKYEIIIIDDCSSDDTAKIARRFKGVRVARHDVNQGVGAARNTGLKEAKGKWVAFIDDDCVADRKWLSELEPQLKKPHTIGAGGLIVPKETTHILQRYLFRSGYGRPASVAAGAAKSIFGRFKAYAKDKFIHASGATEPGEAYEVYGANSAFSKRKLRAIKGFNTDLRSAEDSDICRRLHERYPDEAVHFNPKALVRHEYTPSFQQYLTKLFKRQYDTFDYYRQQHKIPPVYPFPLAFVAVLIVSLFTTWWAPLVVLAVFPLALYGWWTAYAVRHSIPELLLYPYIQLLEESVRVAGLITAGLRRSFARSGAEQISPASQTLSIKSKKTKTTITVVAPRSGFIVSKKIFFTVLAAATFIYLTLETSTVPWRGIVSGPFLAIVPGGLLMLALGVQMSRFKTALYTIVSGIALLLGTGLIANTAVLLSSERLRFDAPLLAVTSGVICLLLGAIAWKRTPRTQSFSVSLAPFRQMSITPLIGLLAFTAPVASAYLNKTGNNMLSMGVLLATVLVAAGMIVWHKKLNAVRTGILLFGIGLTIMLLGATRGDFVPGIDIAREYYLYQLVVHAGHWMPSLMHDAYNSCLSITILPFALSKLLDVNDMVLLRVIFPAMYALTPVVVYALCCRFGGRAVAMLAALFFIVQPSFVSWSSIPYRQMIGILFFAAMLMVIFERRLSAAARNILFLLFGSAMIVSHYSTAYLALGLLLLAYVLQLTHHLWLHKQKPWKLHGFGPVIGLPVIILLFGVAGVWYGPVTHASGNIMHEAKATWRSISHGHHNPLDVFSSNGHASQTSILDQFSAYPAAPDPLKAWNGYISSVNHKYASLYIVPLQQKAVTAPIKPQAERTIPPKTGAMVVNAVSVADSAVRKLVRLFLLSGIVIIVVNIVRRKKVEVVELFALAGAIILALVILVPHASIDYDVGRTSQQLLVLLGLPTVMGGLFLSRFVFCTRLLRRLQYQLVGLSFVILLLVVSGVPAQLTGGHAPTMLLNNSGSQYDRLYVHSSELLAADWLAVSKNDRNFVTAGYFGGNRLWLAGLQRPVVYDDILPWTIDQHAYVFSSYGETTSGVATTYYNGQYVSYPYPTQLISSAKSTLYSNGQTKIYK